MDAAREGEAALAQRLGAGHPPLTLLHQALSRRSWCAEQGGAPSNERLEFLGRYPGLLPGIVDAIR